MYKKIIIIIFLFILNGCASRHQLSEESIARIDTTKGCCNKLSEVLFTKVKIGEEIDIKFEETSPAYIFKSGKSYFSNLELPNSKAKRILSFSSSISSGYLPSATIVVPDILLLNEDKKKIKTFSNIPLSRKEHFFLGSIYTGRVTLPDAAKYAVIHPSRNYSRNIFAPSDSGVIWDIPISLVGDTTVVIH